MPTYLDNARLSRVLVSSSKLIMYAICYIKRLYYLYFSIFSYNIYKLQIFIYHGLFCYAMIEKAIESSMFQQSSDKTFIDKIMGRQDADTIRKLMKKDNLSREDLNQILNLLSSPHCKLWNFNEWDRHIQLKFFVWVREYARNGMLLYDYEDDLRKKMNTCATCGKQIETKFKDDRCTCSTDPNDLLYNELVDEFNEQVSTIFLKYNWKITRLHKKNIQRPKFLISHRTRQTLLNNMRQMQHNIKFLVDLYLNIGNTTLSLGATGFKEILTNKYEMTYASPQGIQSPQMQSQGVKT